MDRNQIIIRTSAVGIAANLGLCAVKFAIGFASRSQAVITDAANNLGDALGSVITIAGTKLSEKKPDRTHPFGYGRVEYMTSIIVAFLVLYVGVQSFFESVRAIFVPQPADFSITSLIILAAALGVKLILGLWTRSKGRSIRSAALEASGTDALSDSMLSGAALVSALLVHFANIDLSAWLGLLIALYIICSGIQLMKHPVDSLIGSRPDHELTRQVSDLILSFKNVDGAYDLVLNGYGETFTIGSVHIQIPDTLSAREIQHLTQQISQEVYRRFRIILTIGIYAANTSDPTSSRIRKTVDQTLAQYDQIIEVHGFYVDLPMHLCAFDLIFDPAADACALRDEIQASLQKQLPDYRFYIVIDKEFV